MTAATAANDELLFLRLASALSAFYPRGSDGKHLLEAMLLAVPR
jgi:hypothetical protein